MKRTDIGREFMERTRHSCLGASEQQQGLAPPPLVSPPPVVGQALALPDPRATVLAPVDIGSLITRRVSRRDYAATPLSLERLSLLLWCTQGVKAVTAGHTLRTVPSAGARHPFETYLMLNAVDGVPAGLYYYQPLDHVIAPCRLGADLGEHLAQVCFGQRFLATAGAVFIWTAVVRRTTWRYQERGYRYIHLDAGHVCQNLYLAAEATDLGVCGIAAFDDEALIRFLGVDRAKEIPVYLASVGVPT